MSNFFDARWLAWPRKFAGPGVGIPGNGLGTEDTIYFNNQIQGLWYVSLSLCLFVFLSLCSLCLFVLFVSLSLCLLLRRRDTHLVWRPTHMCNTLRDMKSDTRVSTAETHTET
jgi:hypothetical protein